MGTENTRQCVIFNTSDCEGNVPSFAQPGRDLCQMDYTFGKCAYIESLTVMMREGLGYQQRQSQKGGKQG